MTILVSGNCGFIGSHLTERLLADRFDVVGVDDLRSSPLPLDELKAEIGPVWNRLQFYRESIEFYAMRGQASSKLTGIFHLASPVGPAGILPYAGKIVEQIVNSTYAVIELALIHRCRLVYVSTSEVYGGGDQGYCSEHTPCLVTINEPTIRLEYAIGKLAGEIAVLNTPGLDAVIIRPFNVSGARQSSRGGFVLPTFCQQALAGKQLTVFGDGSQVRAFTHVDDIVDGLMLAMVKARAGQAYNLGNPVNKTTILDLAKNVLYQLDWDVVQQDMAKVTAGIDKPDPLLLDERTVNERITFTNGKQIFGETYAEAHDKFPNSEKAFRELGWQPKYDIGYTIRDVLAYERKRMVK